MHSPLDGKKIEDIEGEAAGEEAIEIWVRLVAF